MNLLSILRYQLSDINQQLTQKTQQKFQTMSKPRSTDFKSKSLQKKPAQHMYFPAIDAKGIANFPLRKTLRFKASQQNPDKSDPKQPLPSTFEQNPQTNFSHPNLSQRTGSAIIFNDLLKRHQEINRKASSTSKQWGNKSEIYFTKRQLDLLQEKSIELEEQKSKLGQRFLQKKESFESFKKMKQMLREQEKRALLDDLEFKRQERERQHKIRQKQKANELQFLHEQKLSKVEMQRNLKFRSHHEELNLLKQKYSQTEDNSHFLKMEDFKAQQRHMHLLESRLVFLMNDKIKNTEKETYLDERMTSRSFFRESSSKGSQSKVSTGRN